MTSAQRKVHILLWLVLGPLAGLGLMLALDWRPAQPVQDGPLPGLEGQSRESAIEQGVSP